MDTGSQSGHLDAGRGGALLQRDRPHHGLLRGNRHEPASLCPEKIAGKTRPGFMTECDRIQEWLGAWLDGVLPPAKAAEVKLHVEKCAACATEKERIHRLDAADRKSTRPKSRHGHPPYPVFCL